MFGPDESLYDVVAFFAEKHEELKDRQKIDDDVFWHLIVGSLTRAEELTFIDPRVCGYLAASVIQSAPCKLRNIISNILPRVYYIAEVYRGVTLQPENIGGREITEKTFDTIVAEYVTGTYKILSGDSDEVERITASVIYMCFGHRANDASSKNYYLTYRNQQKAQLMCRYLKRRAIRLGHLRVLVSLELAGVVWSLSNIKLALSMALAATNDNKQHAWKVCDYLSFWYHFMSWREIKSCGKVMATYATKPNKK
jgi:hypothetical protein